MWANVALSTLTVGMGLAYWAAIESWRDGVLALDDLVAVVIGRVGRKMARRVP